MNRIKIPLAFKQKDGNFVPIQSPSNTENAQQKPQTQHPLSLNEISPILVLVIIALAVIFFIASLVHLLLRILTKTPNSSSQTTFQSNRFTENSHSLQRQLRQLFRLHDSGLDQTLIDSLPVFRYSDIVGPKQPFDCAVCLCEFSAQDELRLLPACGHAFHARCIDTWLLSNSTCPLCRRVLLVSDLFADDPTSLGLEDRAEGLIDGPDLSADRVFPVRLGKFQGNGEEGSGETGGCELDGRRCHSMGTFRYVEVVGEVSLHVKSNPKLAAQGKVSGRKGESFSVSKIWLWSKHGGRFPGCSDTDIHLPANSDRTRSNGNVLEV